jgi:hypothetical protein
MKKYLSIFNLQTLIITSLSLLSCFLSIRYNIRVYADFLILGIIIVFPLTFTMREAFRRRERSLQYLSLLKASLQSMVYLFQITKMDELKKSEMLRIAGNVTDTLIEYLTMKSGNAQSVQQASSAMGAFIIQHRKETKANSFKIFSFVLRVNESIEFLMAVKRHHTPWGPRAIVLVTIYVFALFYPPAMLLHAGTNIALSNLLLLSAGKIIILVSLYNVQRLMEDTFNPNTPDAIRLEDFRITRESMTAAQVDSRGIDLLTGNTMSYDKILH